MTMARGIEDGLERGTVVREHEGWRVEVEVEDPTVSGLRSGIRYACPNRLDRAAGRAIPRDDADAPGPTDAFGSGPSAGGSGASLGFPRHADREFFEVRTDGRKASLERRRAGLDGSERVPFTVTREQLGRLVEGMEEALETR